MDITRGYHAFALDVFNSRSAERGNALLVGACRRKEGSVIYTRLFRIQVYVLALYEGFDRPV